MYLHMYYRLFFYLYLVIRFLFTVISVSSEIATNDSSKSAILIYNKEIPENIDV